MEQTVVLLMLDDNIVLNGTDEISSNADSDMIGESVLTYDNITLSDIIRPDLIVLSHDDTTR
jgi:hypothetical protein